MSTLIYRYDFKLDPEQKELQVVEGFLRKVSRRRRPGPKAKMRR